MSYLKKFLRQLLLVPIALVFVFEEWGWEPLARMFARLARLRAWAWLEQNIARFPPWAALLTFGLPVITLLPVKLFALYLFGHGHPYLGITLVLTAKLVGTAVLARLFQLTQPALLRLKWFARWYPVWKAWKDRLVALVRRSAVWGTVQATMKKMRNLWRNFQLQSKRRR